MGTNENRDMRSESSYSLEHSAPNGSKSGQELFKVEGSHPPGGTAPGNTKSAQTNNAPSELSAARKNGGGEMKQASPPAQRSSGEAEPLPYPAPAQTKGTAPATQTMSVTPPTQTTDAAPPATPFNKWSVSAIMLFALILSLLTLIAPGLNTANAPALALLFDLLSYVPVFIREQLQTYTSLDYIPIIIITLVLMTVAYGLLIAFVAKLLVALFRPLLKALRRSPRMKRVEPPSDKSNETPQSITQSNKPPAPSAPVVSRNTTPENREELLSAQSTKEAADLLDRIQRQTEIVKMNRSYVRVQDLMEHRGEVYTGKYSPEVILSWDDAKNDTLFLQLELETGIQKVEILRGDTECTYFYTDREQERCWLALKKNQPLLVGRRISMADGKVCRRYAITWFGGDIL